MSYVFEDVQRSLYEYAKNHADLSGVVVIQSNFKQATAALSSWMELHIVSLYPDATRMADQLERGSVRVFCRSRLQPNVSTKSVPTMTPYAMVDKVRGVLRGADITVKDWTANGGTSTVGFIHADEVQVDDVGEAEDHVRTVICTTRILVSAA